MLARAIRTRNPAKCAGSSPIISFCGHITMQTFQGNIMASLDAVDAFFDANADKLASVITTGARQKLRDVRIDLNDHATAQAGNDFSAQVATRRQKELRRSLTRDHMRPIARIARADVPRTPATEPLRMPRGTVSTARFVSAAKGMAEAAAPFTAIFVDHGMPADFIARTTAAADALLASVTARKTHRGQRGGATLGLKDKLSEGRALVLVLDAFVQTALKDDPALLANWNIIKRVRLVARRQLHTPEAPATTPVTPAPGTSQAA